MERIKIISKAWDRTNPDPEKNYGIHGAELRMVLKGTLGAVQFILFTGRYLKKNTKNIVKDAGTMHNLSRDQKKYILDNYSGPFKKGQEIEQIIEFQKWLDSEGIKSFIIGPQPADLGYHSPIPMYDGHTRIGENKYVWRDPTEEEIAEGITSKVPEAIKVPEEEIPICEFVGGVPCYYDGSGLNADRIYDVLKSRGEEAVWKELESFYIRTFGELL